MAIAAMLTEYDATCLTQGSTEEPQDLQLALQALLPWDPYSEMDGEMGIMCKDYAPQCDR